nr:unnamed protein product [Callosobruchus chinensis]
MNGLPPYGNGQPHLSATTGCSYRAATTIGTAAAPVVQPDTSSPPPTQQPPPPPPPSTAFGNSSVPYAFQQFAQMPPNRSMFHYSHQQAAQAQQQQHRPPGAAFTPFPRPTARLLQLRQPNQGSECTGPHIDEITQKKAYQLEYAAAPPTAAQQAPPTAALAGQEAEK